MLVLEVSKAFGETVTSKTNIAVIAAITTRYIEIRPIIERCTTFNMHSPSSSISVSGDFERPASGGVVGGTGGVVVSAIIFT